MALEMVLLGRVDLGVDGRVARLPAGRPRALLVALLLGRGRRVSDERLLSALWEGPPPSARTNLRAYVGDLRRALGPERDRLVRAAGGYLLRVEPGELDLDRWEAGLAAAQEDARRGAPAGAAARLEAALALWSGSAADGVPRLGPTGRSLDALDEARRGAVERYAEVCLDAGRYGAAVECLRPFLAEHPDRETGWRHLVVALARGGDRCRALEAYVAARNALVAEVGVEPGPELRDLHRRLLAEEAPPAAAPAAAPAPALPPETELVGRDGLLAAVAAALSVPGVVALDGPAGVGKSVLAIAAAWRLADRYPDGQLYLDLCGNSPSLPPMPPAEALAGLLRLVGVAEPTGRPSEDMAVLRTRLAHRRTVVVLDNAVDAAQVRPLLSCLAGAAVVVASRAMLSTLDVALQVSLGELDTEASVALLGRYGAGARVAAAPDAARDLAALCGRLPLALRIVGARLAGHPEWSLEAMVGRLADEQFRLDELACDDLAVRAGLEVSCRMLLDRPHGRAALSVLDRWGLTGVPTLGPGLARVLAGGSARDARAAVDRLADARLVDPVGPDRFGQHDLVRLHALERGRALPPDEREDVLARVRRYYLATAQRAKDLVRPDFFRLVDAGGGPAAPFDDGRGALDWLDAERANLVALVRAAAGEGSPAGARFAVQLVPELYPYLLMRGHRTEWLEVTTAAVESVRGYGDRDAEAIALVHVADARSRLGDPEQAVATLRAALALRDDGADRRLTASVLDSLASQLTNAGALDEAVRVFRRAVALRRELGDARALGVTLNNVADALMQQGRTGEALDHLHESLTLNEGLGDRLGLSMSLLTIGQVYAQDRQWEPAHEWLSRALTAARDSGYRLAERTALTVRAETCVATGRRDAARRDLTAALALAAEIGDDTGATDVRAALGRLTG